MNRKYLILSCTIVVFLLSFFLSLYFGAEKIPLKAFWGMGSKFNNIILFDLRLPRSLLAILSGILLGGSGAVFQLFFRNPLAEPGIMGISSGATLGAVIATMASSLFPFLSNINIPFLNYLYKFIAPINFAAFLGAIISGLLVTFFAFSKAGRRSTIMLLLCGTALGTLYSSISSIIILTTDKEFHSIYTWILGSFNGRGWDELIFILIPSILSIIIMFSLSSSLDLLSSGETSARSLGLDVQKVRVLVLVSGSLAVSAAVCAGGTIGFVGLIAPHIVRSVIGPRGKSLIPYSMAFGSILLLIADTIARLVIRPGELPTGLITSILGVPFFISLCLKEK